MSQVSNPSYTSGCIIYRLSPSLLPPLISLTLKYMDIVSAVARKLRSHDRLSTTSDAPSFGVPTPITGILYQ